MLHLQTFWEGGPNPKFPNFDISILHRDRRSKEENHVLEFAGGISCFLGTARDQREMVNHMAQEEGSASGPGRKGRGNVERGWLMR